MMTPSKNRLLKPDSNLATKVPAFLTDLPRWAPWRATWIETKGKWDKMPVYASQPQRGLSIAHPEKWSTFEVALDAYLKHGDALSLGGVGFCLTDLRGIVAVDLDKCSDADGTPAPWAASILDRAHLCEGYRERSPSGNGFRIFMQGHCDDWTNHSQGIEVYAGNNARFVTVTGHELMEDLL